MICIPCRRSAHDDCLNIEKNVSNWCDCLHKSGVILQPQHCNHYSKKSNHVTCPTCGKVFDDQDNSDGDTTPAVLEGTDTEELPTETEEIQLVDSDNDIEDGKGRVAQAKTRRRPLSRRN